MRYGTHTSRASTECACARVNRRVSKTFNRYVFCVLGPGQPQSVGELCQWLEEGWVSSYLRLRSSSHSGAPMLLSNPLQAALHQRWEAAPVQRRAAAPGAWAATLVLEVAVARAVAGRALDRAAEIPSPGRPALDRAAAAALRSVPRCAVEPRPSATSRR